MVTTDSFSNLHPSHPQARREGDRAARRWRSLRVGGACALVEEPAHWWACVTGGAARLVEDPARRWRSLCAGGARSPVEEPTRRWSCALVEEITRWCLDDWLQEGANGGGAEP
jgi:hypothetical protein